MNGIIAKRFQVVTAFIKRFADNYRSRGRRDGPLATEAALKVWLKFSHEGHGLGNATELRQDSTGILRCYGRVQVYNPIFIPKKSVADIPNGLLAKACDEQHES